MKTRIFSAVRECRRPFNAVNFARKDRRTLPQVVVGLPRYESREVFLFLFFFLFSFQLPLLLQPSSFTRHFPVPSFPSWPFSFFPVPTSFSDVADANYRPCFIPQSYVRFLNFLYFFPRHVNNYFALVLLTTFSP